MEGKENDSDWKNGGSGGIDGEHNSKGGGGDFCGGAFWGLKKFAQNLASFIKKFNTMILIGWTNLFSYINLFIFPLSILSFDFSEGRLILKTLLFIFWLNVQTKGIFLYEFKVFPQVFTTKSNWYLFHTKHCPFHTSYLIFLYSMTSTSLLFNWIRLNYKFSYSSLEKIRMVFL